MYEEEPYGIRVRGAAKNKCEVLQGDAVERNLDVIADLESEGGRDRNGSRNRCASLMALCE